MLYSVVSYKIKFNRVCLAQIMFKVWVVYRHYIIDVNVREILSDASCWARDQCHDSILQTFHQFYDLDTELDLLPNREWFPWSICNGCEMPTRNILTFRAIDLAYSSCWNQLAQTCRNFPDFSSRISFATFWILHKPRCKSYLRGAFSIFVSCGFLRIDVWFRFVSLRYS